MSWVVLEPGTLKTNFELKDFFGSDKPGPKVFLTGDGHRSPCFSWVAAHAHIKEYFETAVAEQRVYAYVEVRPEAVTAELVPPVLTPLLAQRHIVGWELPLFEQLLPSMNKSMDFVSLEIDFGKIGSIKPFMDEYGALMTAVAEILRSNQIMDLPTYDRIGAMLELVTKYERGKFDQTDAGALKKKALEYFNGCMGLRVSEAYHRAVGTNIQRDVLPGGDTIHLISVGDSHLTCDGPLQQYIDLETRNAHGWVDASQQ